MSSELVAELSAAINARVEEMDHYVNPDGLKHTRHKGDHLHLAFNQRVIEQPLGGAGIFDTSMARLVANPKSMECLDAVGCTDKKFWSTKDSGQSPFTYQAGVNKLIKGWVGHNMPAFPFVASASPHSVEVQRAASSAGN